MAYIWDILEYLLYLQSSGLALHSLRMHVVVISVFHPPIHGKLAFSKSMIVRLLEMSDSFQESVKKLVPLWEP